MIASRLRRAVVAILVAAAIGATLPASVAAAPTPYGATPRPAACQPGDRPEPGVQGEVTKADRTSGRSALGSSCNLSLVGQSQGQGTSWVNQQYGHCAYVGQSLVGNLLGDQRGVRVLDVSDPSAPRLTALLTSPAMAGDTWESLRVNQKRGLLAAVAVGPVVGALFFDIYDVATDCAHPRLLDSIPGTNLSIPANVIGHEGGFSPDGLTYWSSGVLAGSITAIDVANPAHPRAVWSGVTGVGGHGFDISPDGDRMYLTSLSGFTTFDISQVQHRAPLPVVRRLGSAIWSTVAPQHTISVTYRGKPWIITVDEISKQGIHFVDNSDPAKPIVHPGITLEIQQPANAALAASETGNDALGLFGYGPHYCTVDRITEPTTMACGFFESGIRVFDIRDFAHPREIAYFNPPAQTATRGKLVASWHAALGDLTADWCTSPPAFVGNQLWVTCQDNGFMVLRFAAGTYPLASSPEAATGPAGQPRPGASAPATTASARTAASTNAASQEQLAATGGSSKGLVLGLALVTIALLLRGLVVAAAPGRRRGLGRVVPVVLVVAVAAATTIAVGAIRPAHAASAEAASERFAITMIGHHDEAIAMAREVRSDPRTSATNRTFAAQIEVQQTYEVGLLSTWLRQHGDAVPDPADHEAHAAAMVAGDRTETPQQFNDSFVAMMAAHHLAGIPLSRNAAQNAEPAIARLASSMLVDQSIEVVYMDRVLGSAGPSGAHAQGTPFVCELRVGPRPVT